MAIKVRKKPCRHCLFTKNALGTPEAVAGSRMDVQGSGKPFQCHEHSEAMVCCMDYRQQPDKVSGAVEMANYNGDLKAHFSQMPKAQMDEYSYLGIKY
jgi:hypothetical protein